MTGQLPMNREQRRRQRKRERAKENIPPVDRAQAEALGRARHLLETGDLQNADELCQDISASIPLDAEPFHLRAVIQYRLGHLPKAGELILEAITRNDDDPEIHSNCGAIMNMLGRYPEAEAACRHVIELDPRRADAYGNLAVALEMQGRLDEAIEAARHALSRQPDYPEARINLGNMLVRTGDVIGAVEAYVRTIEQAPENPVAHANLSVALLRLQEVDAAETSARQALGINPVYPEALNALGNALAAQNRFAEAICQFDKALALQSTYIEASLNRAAALLKKGEIDHAVTAYRHLIVDGKAAGEVFFGLAVALLSIGETDDAIAAFRDAIRVKPALGNAHYNLACALGAAVKDVEFEQMKNLLAETITPTAEKIPLYFAVGEISDKRGAVEDAFAAFRAGNALRKQALLQNEIRFDPASLERDVDAIIAAFPAGHQPARETVHSDIDRPVFIVGMPRSGTTLVEQILVAHQQIDSLGEAASFLGIEEPFEDLREATLRALAKPFIEQTLATRIIDKTPFHFLSIGLIERVFPRARIIHCRRRPDDVALSCYFQNFISDYAWATELADIRTFMAAEKRLMDHWKDVSTLPILTIDYENLVENTERVARELLDFLQLDWDAGCLDFHASGAKSFSASNWQVRKPVYTTAVNRAAPYRSFIEPII